MIEEFAKLVPGAKKLLPLRKFEVYVFKEEALKCGVNIRGVQGQIKAKSYDHFDIGTASDGDIRVFKIQSNVETDEELKVFSYLIEFVLSELSKSSVPKTKEILASIQTWLEFSKSKKRTLSKSKQIGLLGELIFLETLMERFPEVNHLEGWAGPDGSPIDFLFGEKMGVEVKSRIQPFKDWVSISSTSQLDNSLPELHLAVFDFVPTDSGFNLKDKIEVVKAKFNSMDEQHLFLAALEKAGYNQFPGYSNLLKVRLFRSFSLDSRVEGFPILTKPSDLRIDKVKYDIHIGDQEQLDLELTYSKIRNQWESN